MTAQDVQTRLDTIVSDLQNKAKGKTTNIMFRDANNLPAIKPLSSDANGVVDAAQLADVQAFVDTLKTALTNYNTASAPVEAATETFKTERTRNLPTIEAARVAAENLKTTLEADAAYTAAKTQVETARSEPGYVSATEVYRNGNISENIAELTQARGAYV